VSLEAFIARNKHFLADLFAGPFHGHGIIAPVVGENPGWAPDFTCSDHPVSEWVPWAVRNYRLWCEQLQVLGDDSVPYVSVTTGTQVFAAAFGCQVYCSQDTNPSARPLVWTAEEADRLVEPPCDAPPLDRVFEFAERVRALAGPQVPICVPDIQSPFDIAALIWNKADLYSAMYENPGAVKRLVDKCHHLLEAFLKEYVRRSSPVNLIHYPTFWAPNELGCSLSEDEAGNMSTAMFEEFCVPSLVDLSRAFGGMFVHCCATADHQHSSFLRIPRLRAMQRNFGEIQGADPRRTVADFSGRCVLPVVGVEEDWIVQILRLARPDTRFLFVLPARPLEELQPIYARLCALCPRS
jgi:hypothetical protein